MDYKIVLDLWNLEKFYPVLFSGIKDLHIHIKEEDLKITPADEVHLTSNACWFFETNVHHLLFNAENDNYCCYLLFFYCPSSSPRFFTWDLQVESPYPNIQMFTRGHY